jgi:hypothetical protein
LQQLLQKIEILKNLLSLPEKQPFVRIDIKKAWQQALRKADIANCRAYAMRQTFCTYAAEKGTSNSRTPRVTALYR